MKNEYKALKDTQQARVNAFPFMFAFSKEQFAEGLEKLHTDAAGLVSIGGGGYVRKSDADAMHKMFAEIKQETAAAIAADTTGDGFIFQMFDYELANHEYSYTGDISETLDALGFTLEEVNSSPALLHGLKKAIDAQSEE